MIPEDRLTEVTAANRKNVEITHLVKSASGKGEVARQPDTRHQTDFSVL
jgi:CRISPR-associated protein Cas2